MKYILLTAFVFLGIANADFIRDNEKEIVNDTVTCLMWQDNNSSKSVKKTWQEAILYCENMVFNGYDDWRLPNLNELYSLGDKSKIDPAIKDAFVYVGNNHYWSSTTNVSNTSYAWSVHFGYGNDYFGAKNKNYYIRCVRDSQ